MRERLAGALVLLLSTLIIITALPSVLSAGVDSGTKVFIEEGGEEPTYDEWNNRWPMRYDANNDATSSQDWWCRQMHQVHSGLRSIYCARNGFNSHYQTAGGEQPWNVNLTSQPDTVPQTDWVLRYDTNQDSILRKEVNGAKYYNNIAMTFWFYSDTGVSDATQPGSGVGVGYDFLNALYYTGSGEDMEKHILWTNSYEQATAKTWTEITLNVPNTATWIGFEFVSGTIAPEGGDAPNTFSAQGISVVNSGMKEGVFLDDIKVVGTDPAPDVPLATSIAALPPYQKNMSFPVSIEDNDPQVGLKYAYIYYREAGEVNWTKYVTDANPGGTFSVFPVTFTAPHEGTYELFSVGVDQHDVVEERRDSADTSTVLDATAPVSKIILSGNKAGDAYDGAASIVLNATDSGSGVSNISYRIDGSAWMDYTLSIGLATDGDHVIDYYATDMAGNAEQVKSVNVSIINGAFGIIFDGNTTSFTGGDVTIDFSVVAGSAVSKLQYSLDSGAFVELNSSARSVSLTGLGNGGHTLTIRATDTDGNLIQGKLDFTVSKSGSATTIWGTITQPLVLVVLAAVAAMAVGGIAWRMRRKR